MGRLEGFPADLRRYINESCFWLYVKNHLEMTTENYVETNCYEIFPSIPTKNLPLYKNNRFKVIPNHTQHPLFVSPTVRDGWQADRTLLYAWGRRIIYGSYKRIMNECRLYIYFVLSYLHNRPALPRSV